MGEGELALADGDDRGGRGRPASVERCHLTVEAAGRRVDLALPARAPLAELMPALVELCLAGAAPPAEEGRPPAWTLARPGGPALPLACSLAEAGVVDGEVLYLVDVAEWRPPVVSDLAGTVAETVEHGARPWTRRETASLLAGIGGLTLGAGMAVAVWTRALAGWGGAMVLLAGVALLAAAGLRRRRRGRVVAALPLAGPGWALVGMGGWAVAGASWDAAGLAWGGGALALGGLALWPALGAAAAAGTVMAGALALVAGAAALGVPPQVSAAAVVAIGVVALRVLPYAVTSLASALGLLRAEEGPAGIVAMVRRCRELLASLSVGVIGATLGGIVVELLRGGPAAVALALLAAVSLLLRACSYRFHLEVLPLAAAAGLALVAALVALALRVGVPGAQPLLGVGLLLLVGLALLLASALGDALPALPDPPGAVWLVVDLSLAPLTLTALGVLSAVATLVGRLVR